MRPVIRCRLKKTVLLLLLIITAISHSAFSDNNNSARVAIIPPFTVHDDAALNALALTLSDTTRLTLQLLGNYEIHAPEAIPQNEAEIAAFASESAIDNVLYGSIQQNNSGAYVISLSVYDQGEKRTSITEEAIADSIFDIFDVSDTLIVNLISGFSGRHIGYGSIRFENTGVSAPYKVFIDNTLVGRNVTEIPKLLYGNHTIRVSSQRDNNIVLLEESFFLEENSNINFDFAVPFLSTEALFEIDKAERGVFENFDLWNRDFESSLQYLQEFFRLNRGHMEIAEFAEKQNAMVTGNAAFRNYANSTLGPLSVQFDGDPGEWEHIHKINLQRPSLKVDPRYTPEYIQFSISPDSKLLQILVKMEDSIPRKEAPSIVLPDQHIHINTFYDGRWETRTAFDEDRHPSGEFTEIIHTRNSAVKGPYMEIAVPILESEIPKTFNFGVWIHDNDDSTENWYQGEFLRLRDNWDAPQPVPSELLNVQSKLLTSFVQPAPVNGGYSPTALPEIPETTAIPFAAIQIDGSDDDWKNIAATVEDDLGDSSDNRMGHDIISVKTAHDDEWLSVYWEVNGTTPAAAPTFYVFNLWPPNGEPHGTGSFELRVQRDAKSKDKPLTPIGFYKLLNGEYVRLVNCDFRWISSLQFEARFSRKEIEKLASGVFTWNIKFDISDYSRNIKYDETEPMTVFLGN